MDLKQIKELIAAMEKGGVKKLRVKDEKGGEIELERILEPALEAPFRAEPYPHFAPPAPAPLRGGHEEGRDPKVHMESTGKKFVTSPMVGIFYAAASPDDPPFVKVGDEVESESVVCIIEAMKVMNEVKAGMKGRIAEILVDNAHAVEFGTKIFRIV